MRFALLAILSAVEGVFIPLNAVHKAQCFLTKRVENSNVISGSYEISGTAEVAEHFKHTVTAPGQYNLCFKQTSTRSRQTVSFQLHVAGDFDFFENGASNVASSGQIDKIGLYANELQAKVYELIDQQDYAITREAIHRETAESTNSRVLWWSLGQVLMVLTMSVVQMYFIRRFFEVKLIV